MKNVAAISTAISAMAMLACATAQAQLLDPEAQAFSFQARLTGPGIPQNGTVDLAINIYDADAGGNVVSGPHDLADQPIANNVVSVTIPGINLAAFDEGQRLWVGVSVNAGAELTPRVPLIAVPYALRVHRVGNTELDDDLTLGDGVTSGSLQIYDDQGATAIALFGQPGAGNPNVDVSGTVRMTGFVLDDPTEPGFVLTSDSWGQGTWQSLPLGGGHWSAAGDDIYNNNAGNVGIGTDTPQYPLHVAADAGQGLHSVSTSGTGVYGLHAQSTGVDPGVQGTTNSTSANAAGVIGEVSSTSPGAYSAGVRGINAGTGPNGIGVWGHQDGSGWGVYGSSADGYGVYAKALGNSGINYGVHGSTNSPTGYAGYFAGGRNYFEGNVGIGTTNPQYPLDVRSSEGRAVSGYVTAASGVTYGVVGKSDSDTGAGVLGFAAHQSGTNYGVYGMTDSPSGYAGYFQGGRNYFEGNVGIGTANPQAALELRTPSGEVALNMTSGGSWLAQIKQTASSLLQFVNGGQERMTITAGGAVGIGTTNPGYQLHVSTDAARAARFETSSSSADAAAVIGELTSTTPGVRTAGVLGVSNAASGVAGKGVWGYATAAGIGVLGESETGWGVEGRGYFGVVGVNTTGSPGYGVYANGDLGASGSKSFRIDHPLDPANKYLLHYSAEGPEPLLIYHGNAILDGSGEAWVELPEYFEEINRDFHYQLTCIGGFAPVYVAQEIQDNRFKIAGGQGGLKVCWTVSGVRNDAYVRSFGAPVEIEKPEHERGKYQHPELYGEPQERGMYRPLRRLPESVEQPVEPPGPLEAGAPDDAGE